MITHHTNWQLGCMPSHARWLGIALLVSTMFCARSEGQLGRGKEYPQDKEFSLKCDGLERRYIVHTPAGWDGQSRLPLVISLHGGMGRGALQRTMTGFNEVADRHKFMVVYPDGTGPVIHRPIRGDVSILTWNAGRCCGSAVKEKVDDVGFVRAMIDRLAQQFPVDTDRVYATGFSNGSMMTNRLGAELSDKLAAIAPVSGSLMVDGPAPRRPIPILYMHGRKDPNAQYMGGAGKYDKTVHRSVPDTIAWWVRVNHCRPKPVETKEDKDYILERYEPAPGQPGASVTLMTLREGGHAWPGGVDANPQFEKGKLIESVPASEIIWDFFSKYRLGDKSVGTTTSPG